MSLSVVRSVVTTAVEGGTLAASVSAVSKLVACVGLGYIASAKGVLDPAATATLSKLIYSVFQPALLLVNVASTLASPTESFKTISVIPLFALAQVAIGAGVGKLIIRFLGVSKSSACGRELRMSSAFGNSGPLPLLFADALFRTHKDPTLAPRAVAFISFYLLGWSPAFWTYGRSILAPPKPAKAADILGAADQAAVAAQASSQGQGWVKAKKAQLAKLVSDVKASPQTARVLSPPVLGCLLGALVGGVPFLKHAFMGSSAPLRPLTDSLRTLGQAYIPAVILTLAGTLHQSVQTVRKEKQAQALAGGQGAVKAQAGDKDKDQVGLGTKVGALMAARFLAMPLFGLALLSCGTKLGWIPKDPLLRFVLLMEACMPCAQNSVVILQLENDQKAAGSMAMTISALYVVAVVPIAVLLSAASMYAGL